MSTASARASEPTDAPRQQTGRAARSPWLWVAGLYAVAAAVYLVLALRTALPVLFPDELRYSHLARGLADGTGFDWRGAHVDQTAALYMYFITPAWALFSSTVDAWHASKVLGTLALCTQIVPVWLLARELVGPKLALVPATLTVLCTSMLMGAETVTEALALPLSTASLCVAALALRRPTSHRLGLLALVLALLATWARIQLAVLIPAFFVALIIDVLRDPERRGARLHAHRVSLAVLGAGFAALVVLALTAPGVTGEYQNFFKFRPSLDRIFSRTGLQLLELAAVAGFLPVLLAAGAIVSPRAWRDDRSGPLLALFWPAALVTVAQSGFFLAGYPPALSAIDRYVAYAVPIAFVLATVLLASPGLLSRAGLVVAGLLALPFLARPGIEMMGEERASWGLAYRLHQVVGVGTGLGLAVVSLLLVGVVAWVRERGTPSPRAVLIAGGAVAVVLLVQSQAAWWQMQKTASSFRSTMPADLEWVDHHASGPVALLGITQNAPQFDDVDYFNRKVTQTFVPAAGLSGRLVQGKQCTFEFAVSGALKLAPGCGRTPTRFLVNDPSARVTFQDQVRTATDKDYGRVIELEPDTVPRARSLIVLPCPRRTPGYSATTPDIIADDVPIECSATLTGALWLDDAAQVEVRYRGGTTGQTVKVGGRQWTIPAGPGTTTVRFSAAKGYSQFAVRQGWTSSAGTPVIAGVDLVGSDGTITPISW
jgi:hypothetical protein